MATLQANNYYQTNQITTVSPGQLLLLVYDGALRFLAEGKQAMAEKRFEDQNTYLTKAQALIVELVATLDHQVNPGLATNLERLYYYMYDRLVIANIEDNEGAITEVASLLSELREAWAGADLKVRCGETAVAAGGVQ